MILDYTIDRLGVTYGKGYMVRDLSTKNHFLSRLMGGRIATKVFNQKLVFYRNVKTQVLISNYIADLVGDKPAESNEKPVGTTYTLLPGQVENAKNNIYDIKGVIRDSTRLNLTTTENMSQQLTLLLGEGAPILAAKFDNQGKTFHNRVDFIKKQTITAEYEFTTFRDSDSVSDVSAQKFNTAQQTFTINMTRANENDLVYTPVDIQVDSSNDFAIPNTSEKDKDYVNINNYKVDESASHGLSGSIFNFGLFQKQTRTDVDICLFMLNIKLFWKYTSIINSVSGTRLKINQNAFDRPKVTILDSNSPEYVRRVPTLMDTKDNTHFTLFVPENQEKEYSLLVYFLMVKGILYHLETFTQEEYYLNKFDLSLINKYSEVTVVTPAPDVFNAVLNTITENDFLIGDNISKIQELIARYIPSRHSAHHSEAFILGSLWFNHLSLIRNKKDNKKIKLTPTFPTVVLPPTVGLFLVVHPQTFGYLQKNTQYIDIINPQLVWFIKAFSVINHGVDFIVHNSLSVSILNNNQTHEINNRQRSFQESLFSSVFKSDILMAEVTGATHNMSNTLFFRGSISSTIKFFYDYKFSDNIRTDSFIHKLPYFLAGYLGNNNSIYNNLSSIIENKQLTQFKRNELGYLTLDHGVTDNVINLFAPRSGESLNQTNVNLTNYQFIKTLPTVDNQFNPSDIIQKSLITANYDNTYISIRVETIKFAGMKREEALLLETSQTSISKLQPRKLNLQKELDVKMIKYQSRQKTNKTFIEILPALMNTKFINQDTVKMLEELDNIKNNSKDFSIGGIGFNIDRKTNKAIMNVIVVGSEELALERLNRAIPDSLATIWSLNVLGSSEFTNTKNEFADMADYYDPTDFDELKDFDKFNDKYFKQEKQNKPKSLEVKPIRKFNSELKISDYTGLGKYLTNIKLVQPVKKELSNLLVQELLQNIKNKQIKYFNQQKKEDSCVTETIKYLAEHSKISKISKEVINQSLLEVENNRSIFKPDGFIEFIKNYGLSTHLFIIDSYTNLDNYVYTVNKKRTSNFILMDLSTSHVAVIQEKMFDTLNEKIKKVYELELKGHNLDKTLPELSTIMYIMGKDNKMQIDNVVDVVKQYKT